MSSESEHTVVEVPLNELFINARESKGLSLESVASRLNLSIAQMQKMESNTFNPASLSTFERGYVRNYAALLEIAPEVFDGYFPESDSVCSELQSVQRYSSPANKPLFSPAFFKGVFGLIIVGLIAFLVWSNMPVVEKMAFSSVESEKVEVKGEAVKTEVVK